MRLSIAPIHSQGLIVHAYVTDPWSLKFWEAWTYTIVTHEARCKKLRPHVKNPEAKVQLHKQRNFVG